jgi:hypothetical protein
MVDFIYNIPVFLSILAGDLLVIGLLKVELAPASKSSIIYDFVAFHFTALQEFF